MFDFAESLPKVELNGMPVIYDAAEVARRLEHEEVLGFDIETSGLSPWRDRIATIQLYGQKSGTLGFIRTYGGVVPEPIKAVLSDPRYKHIIGHNIANFDIQFLEEANVNWTKANWWDSLVGECIVTTAGRKNVSVSLKNTLRRRLQIDISKDIDHGSWENDILTPEQVVYAMTDVALLPSLLEAQQIRAAETEQTMALEMEMQAMPVYARMVCNGLPVLPENVEKYVEAQVAEANELEIILRKYLGDINLQSPAQLRSAIKEATGIPIMATNKDALITYAEQDNLLGELTSLLLRWKEPNQRANMYSDPWSYDFITDGWVHSKIWQAKTDTTRSASSDPNFQQVPKDGRMIVGGLEGLSIVSTDLSQIELRVAADASGDEALRKALIEEDVHTAVASMMFKVPYAEVTKDQRRGAKAASFALLYDGSGKTVYRTSRLKGGSITLSEAFDIEHRFFQAFPGLHAMRMQARNRVKRSGPIFIRLANGTRRMLVGRDKKASSLLNTICQGNAAVGLKLGVIEAGRRGLDVYMGLAVHDEIVSCVPDPEAPEFAKEMEESLVVGMSKILQVPVKASSTIGLHWS